MVSLMRRVPRADLARDVGVTGEANLSAEEPTSLEEARFSSSDVNPGRPGHLEVPTAEGPSYAVGLIGPVGDRATFAALRRSPRRVRKGPITVTYAVGPSMEHVRVAYAIGRNVGGAVQRNRLRRRLRAVMSEQGARLPSGAYLVGAGPGATSLSFDELKESVTRALEDERLQAAPEGESHS